MEYNNDILDLLERYLDNNVNEEERFVVEEWYKGLDHEALPDQSWDDQKIKNEIFEQIHNRAFKKVGKTRALPLFIKIAAASVLLVIVLLFINQFQKKSSAVAENQIQPGSNKAVLKLSDGRIIMLDSTGNGNIASINDAVFTKTGDGIDIVGAASGTNSVSYNTIETPNGGQYVMKLADGTKVWLNATTKFKFPARFDNKERRIFLDGEAYFDVAHDSSKPFIVSVSGKQDIIVHGTSFNVNAYNDSKDLKTTLVRGSIEVQVAHTKQTLELRPGQQSVLKPGQEIVKYDVDVEPYISWKDGYFKFKQLDLPEIMKQLSRWYNADFILSPDLKHETFTGTITRKESVGELIKLFETTNMMKFNVKDKKIYVVRKN